MNTFILLLKSLLYVICILFFSATATLFFKDIIVYNIRNDQPKMEEITPTEPEKPLYIISPNKEV
jgi:hypothetical protein